MSYLDEFEEKRNYIWKNFIICDGILHKFNKLNILKEIDEEIERIERIKKSNIPSVATAITDNDRSGAANYFIINDIGYGDVCEKCGSSLYILLLQDQDHVKNLDNKVWVPSGETYFALNIPIEEIYRFFPVPVNTDTDLWICPFCKEIHKFKYNNDIGLIYDQKILM